MTTAEEPAKAERLPEQDRAAILRLARALARQAAREDGEKERADRSDEASRNCEARRTP